MARRIPEGDAGEDAGSEAGLKELQTTLNRYHSDIGDLASCIERLKGEDEIPTLTGSL